MLLGDIIKDVQAIFGDKSEVQVTHEDITRWANQAQINIAQRTDVLSGTETLDGDLNADGLTYEVNRYPLPVDLLKFNSVFWDGKLLAKTTQAELNFIFSTNSDDGSATGTPIRFYVKERYLYPYPVPDVSDSEVHGYLSVYYVRRPVPLVVSNDEPELPQEMHEEIVQFCLAKCYELDENFQQAAIKKQEFKDSLNEDFDAVKWPHNDEYPSVQTLGNDY